MTFFTKNSSYAEKFTDAIWNKINYRVWLWWFCCFKNTLIEELRQILTEQQLVGVFCRPWTRILKTVVTCSVGHGHVVWCCILHVNHQCLSPAIHRNMINNVVISFPPAVSAEPSQMTSSLAVRMTSRNAREWLSLWTWTYTVSCHLFRNISFVSPIQETFLYSDRSIRSHVDCLLRVVIE